MEPDESADFADSEPTIKLSGLDWAVFLAALEDLPPLPEKLKQAIDRQRKKIREEPKAGRVPLLIASPLCLG
jgi:hypothetical protein